MAVRIKIRIKRLDSRHETVDTVALVNAGYETDEPEIILPMPVAERLRLIPNLPNNTKIEEYGTLGGKVRCLWVPKCVEAWILPMSKSSKPVRAHAVLSDSEKEVLLNDKLAGAMKIIIEDIGKGYWRLPGERKLRVSEEAEYHA
jgi:hypothetical protein